MVPGTPDTAPGNAVLRRASRDRGQRRHRPRGHQRRRRGARGARGRITDTVTGTFTNAAGQGTFAGTFAPKKFSVANGVLEATGLLKGTMTDANGTKIASLLNQILALP